MRKFIITIFAFLVLSAPFAVTYAAYTTGGGLVPVCNKGELIPYNVLDENGNKVYDANNKEVIDYRLGETKCDFNQLITLVNTVIDFLLFYIASPIAAIIFCYAGFKLVTSGGNEEAMTGAKKMLGNMVKGYVIALAAWLVIHTLVTTLNFTGETFLQD